jgi:hypothetical protein
VEEAPREEGEVRFLPYETPLPGMGSLRTAGHGDAGQRTVHHAGAAVPAPAAAGSLTARVPTSAAGPAPVTHPAARPDRTARAPRAPPVSSR